MNGAWGSVVVKALRYYTDGPGNNSWWCHWIFQWHIPSDCTMAVGSTQPLVKMSTRNMTSPPSCAECHEIWEPKPPGTLWAPPSLLRDSFTFTSRLIFSIQQDSILVDFCYHMLSVNYLQYILFVMFFITVFHIFLYF
jgi:hypothetical protein